MRTVRELRSQKKRRAGYCDVYHRHRMNLDWPKYVWDICPIDCTTWGCTSMLASTSTRCTTNIVYLSTKRKQKNLHLEWQTWKVPHAVWVLSRKANVLCKLKSCLPQRQTNCQVIFRRVWLSDEAPSRRIIVLSPRKGWLPTNILHRRY
jgi:hypothetical protein